MIGLSTTLPGVFSNFQMTKVALMQVAILYFATYNFFIIISVEQGVPMFSIINHNKELTVFL